MPRRGSWAQLRSWAHFYRLPYKFNEDSFTVYVGGDTYMVLRNNTYRNNIEGPNKSMYELYKNGVYVAKYSSQALVIRHIMEEHEDLITVRQNYYNLLRGPNGGRKTQYVPLRVPKAILEVVDQLVMHGLFEHRSGAMRELMIMGLRELVRKEPLAARIVAKVLCQQLSF